MQIICTSLQIDNHASTAPLKFLHAGCPSCHPINSIKALGRTCYYYIVQSLLLDCGSEKTAATLQLQAGCCILKLARQPVFVNMMSYKQLHVLALLVMVSA